MPQYRYMPLSDNQIRIISLLPGAFEDDICFSLTHVCLEPGEIVKTSKRLSKYELQNSLPESWKVYRTLQGQFLFADDREVEVHEIHPNPEIDPELYATVGTPSTGGSVTYEALSYVWGSMREFESVFVQPSLVEDTKALSPGRPRCTLQIGKDLASTIRHLRYKNQQRKLWIDAICINQDDTDERNIQVLRMGHIYSLASRVMVWLGPEMDQTRCAFKVIADIAEQVELSDDNYLIRSPNTSKPDWARFDCTLPFDDEIWQALTSLFKRPWFRRVWTMQEILLANQHALVIWGTQEISFYCLQKATVVLSSNRTVPVEVRGRATYTLDIICGRRIMPLPMLLCNSRRRICLDARDRIFAVLSMAPRQFTQKMRPNYSAPVMQIYKDAMLAAVEAFDRLELLPDVNTVKTDFCEPSWVPDWSFYDGTLGTIRDNFQAAGVSRAVYRYIPPDILTVTGVRCSRIRSVSELIPHDKSQAVKILRASEPDGILNERYPNGESILEAYLRTLYLNNLDRYPTQFSWSTYHAWRETFLEHIGTSATSPNCEYFPDDALDQIAGASFLVTDDQYIGIGPWTAKPGKLLAHRPCA